MAKPSKSQNNEFMVERRKAIADLANRRRRQQTLRAAGIKLDRGNEKVTPMPLQRPSAPPAQN